MREEFGESHDRTGSIARFGLQSQDFAMVLAPTSDQGFEHSHRVNDFDVSKSGPRAVSCGHVGLRCRQQRLSRHDLVQQREEKVTIPPKMAIPANQGCIMYETPT